MISLITAVPGSGKTLFSISLIDAANKERRSVYTNIEGLEKSKFDFPDLIFDAPADWRETPDGSLVIYDECQQSHLYPATAQRGLVTDERLTAMETHRHSGHDLVFITQAPTFVHHHIRKLVGEHYHFYRAHGVSGAMRYKWSHTCDSPNNRQEQKRADSVMWRFPKKYFSYYKSATVHTHKFKIPFKLFFYFVPALLILILAISYISSNKFFNSSHNTTPQAETGYAAAAGSSVPTSWRVVGYIKDGSVNSFGSSHVLLFNGSLTRTISLNLCSFDSSGYNFTCSLDGQDITFFSNLKSLNSSSNSFF